MNIQTMPGTTMLCSCHCLKNVFIRSDLDWNILPAPFFSIV